MFDINPSLTVCASVNGRKTREKEETNENGYPLESTKDMERMDEAIVARCCEN